MSSSSLTEVYGRVVLGVFIVAVLVAIARAAFAAPVALSPEAAIEQAVMRRVGGTVTVDVTAIQTKVAAEAGLQAMPEPGARVGQPARFILLSGRARRGVAIATVAVSGPYARAARVIERDSAVAAADIEVVDGAWPAVPLARMPAPDEVVSLTARRDIAPGEVLNDAVLDIPPLVRSGDTVTVSARVGAVRVAGQAVAGTSGRAGDVIRVTPKPNGRALRARITGPGTVEVLQ